MPRAGIDQPPAGALRIQRLRALARAERVRPAGLGEGSVLVQQRACDGRAVTERLDRELLERTRVVNDRLVGQALHQLAADLRVDRGDEREPEAREPGSEDGNRYQHPAQPALPRVLRHQLAVGGDVGAPDLEHSARARLEVERRDEVGDEVLDRRSAASGCAPSAE